MEAKLKKSTISYYKNLFNSNTCREETAESIVPDALPDILRIVDTSGTVVLRSKDAEKGRASAGGMVNAAIIYVPEGEEEARRMELRIPFSIVYENPDVTPSTRLTASLSLQSIDSRIINPRKILVRADILAEIRGFEAVKTEIAIGAEGNIPAELLEESCSFAAVAEVKEKTFVVSDDFTLPSGKPPIAEIMSSGFCLADEEVKTVGSKLIVRGTVFADAVYRTGDGTLCTADFSTPFSQIIEMESAEDPGFALQLMPTGAYLELNDGGSQSVSLEVHAVAQVVMTDRLSFRYIADAYMNGFEAEIESGKYTFDSVEKQFSCHEQLRIVAETPVPVRNVVFTNVFVGKTERKDDGSGCVFTAPLTVNCGYISEDGRLLSVSSKESVSCRRETPCGDVLYTAAAFCGDKQASAAANGIDIRAGVDFTIAGRKKLELEAVTGISWDESAPKDLSGRPSLIVCRAIEGDTLWAIAKRYGSSVAAITEANEDSDEGLCGRQLLIPKWK